MEILVALDYSKNGQALLSQALQFATAMNASVTLLHVFSLTAALEANGAENTSIPGIPTSRVSKLEFETWCALARNSEEKLATFETPFRDQGIHVQSLHLIGQPGPVICAQASQLNADIVMVGQRSHCSQQERSLGSVSNFVTHHAPCSVWSMQEKPD